VTIAHALSVDVEDYFQVLNMQHLIGRDSWDEYPLRCADGTRRLLELFERRGAKATFFFLGWIAERLPDLVRDVHAAGHEIGSHGYDHRLLPELGAAGFDDDLRQTEEILEGIVGVRPRIFRACTWSITSATPWALPTLQRRGYVLDSSVFPIRHPDYGVPAAPVHPYRVAVAGGALLEFPPLCWEILGKRLPVGGGGYLRLFPLQLLRAGLAQQARRGYPGCVYLHPWEVDPGQPRQDLHGLRRFRHYVNLHRTLPKLDRLLQEFRFVGVLEASAQATRELPSIDVRELLETIV